MGRGATSNRSGESPAGGVPRTRGIWLPRPTVQLARLQARLEASTSRGGFPVLRFPALLAVVGRAFGASRHRGRVPNEARTPGFGRVRRAHARAFGWFPAGQLFESELLLRSAIVCVALPARGAPLAAWIDWLHRRHWWRLRVARTFRFARAALVSSAPCAPFPRSVRNGCVTRAEVGFKGRTPDARLGQRAPCERAAQVCGKTPRAPSGARAVLGLVQLSRVPFGSRVDESAPPVGTKASIRPVCVGHFASRVPRRLVAEVYAGSLVSFGCSVFPC